MMWLVKIAPPRVENPEVRQGLNQGPEDQESDVVSEGSSLCICAALSYHEHQNY
jgi:hypothetical protein